jgi:cysteine desulfurase
MQSIYLDNAATTPTDKSVIEEMLPYMSEKFGNPSSFHSWGQEAQKAVEKARRDISLIIGADPSEIVFTSGGTESNNFAIKGIAYQNKTRGDHIITSSIEHHAVLKTCRFLEGQGFRVTYLPVDRHGIVDPDLLKKAITDKTILISVMHANNEIGTIEPVEEIGKIARDRDICFHTDAVQTFGHLPVNVDKLGVDILSASAHKFYGPKGAGFVYIRKGTDAASFMHGGEQERGRRASTHNVPGIIGTRKAAVIARDLLEEETIKLTRLRDKLIAGISNSIENSELNGHLFKRLANNVNISVQGAGGESMLLNLDLEGISCSTGSACSSSALEPSHVLLALGQNRKKAAESVRFSLGRSTEERDIDAVLDVLPGIVRRIRSAAGYSL